MNATDPRAMEVWNHTLDAIHRERRRRRTRRTALTVAAVMLPVLLMVLRKEPATAVITKDEPPPLVMEMEHPSLAVLVIRDGVPTLEALSPGDLPDTELHLSLAPILADYRDLSEEKF
ncbi:MAG: hypothetical protein KF712_06885 [Akkermansiaceae bacterium]|nr:hypothetical protein [Akkermansiaceae bacterium]